MVKSCLQEEIKISDWRQVCEVENLSFLWFYNAISVWLLDIVFNLGQNLTNDISEKLFILCIGRIGISSGIYGYVISPERHNSWREIEAFYESIRRWRLFLRAIIVLYSLCVTMLFRLHGRNWNVFKSIISFPANDKQSF